MHFNCIVQDKLNCLNKVRKTTILLVFIFCGLHSHSQTTPPDSSRLVRIGEVHIVGNKKTVERIITRELSVKQGESYPLSQVIDTLVFDRNRIYNTNLFNEVEIKVQELENGVADLLIIVDERWYLYPLPIFKLADRNFNDWWVNYNHDFNRVKYGVRLTHFNFRGRAERLRITFQTGFEQRFLFNYRIPYINKKQQHGLTSEFILTSNNNISYKTEDHRRILMKGDEQLRLVTGGSILHTYRKNFYDYHYFGLGMVSAQIQDTIALLNPDYFGGRQTRQKFLSIRYGYQYDRRDNINYALNGSNFFINLSKAGLGVFDDVDYWTVRGAVAKYSNLGHGFFLGNFISGYWSTGNQPFFNVRGLGSYAQTYVRGYELDFIEGQSFLLTKNSFRKFIWKHKSDLGKVIPVSQFRTFQIAVYGKLFFDGGYVKSFKGYENNDRLSDKFIYGLGVGIDLVTVYDLVIRFEYSTNSDRENQFFLNFKTDF